MVRARIIFALQNSLTTLFQFPRQVAMKGNNNPLDSTSQNNPSAVGFIFNCGLTGLKTCPMRKIGRG
jgi:hypothetical protein